MIRTVPGPVWPPACPPLYAVVLLVRTSPWTWREVSSHPPSQHARHPPRLPPRHRSELEKISDRKVTMIWISGSEGGSHERRLLNDLMTHYQKLERPVMEESQAVSLKFGLTLQQILDVVSNFLCRPASPNTVLTLSLSDRMKKIKFWPQTFGWIW